MKLSRRLIRIGLIAATLMSQAGPLAQAEAVSDLQPLRESDEIFVAEGWKFQPQDPTSLRKRPHQIGLLNETAETPLFTSVTVLLIPVSGLSKRSQTSQLARLAKEVAALVNLSSTQLVHISKKVNDGRPRVEAQYGKNGKGFTWAYASIENENVLVMMTQSRELKPPSSTQDTFFKMARAFRTKRTN